MPRRAARRGRAPSAPARNSARLTVTARATRLSTKGRPRRSRMRPRGASGWTMRTRFWSALPLRVGASITCRYQRRENSAAKSHATTTPTTARRSRDVSGAAVLIGAQPPGASSGVCPLGGGAARQRPPDEGDGGQGQHRVHHGHQAGDLGQAGSDELRLADDRADHREQHHTGGAGEQRGDRGDPPAGADDAGLEAADGEADQAEGEGRQPERGLHEQIGHHADAEADQRAPLRTGDQAAGDGEEQQRVGADVVDVDGGEERRLHDEHGEDGERQPHPGACHGRAGVAGAGDPPVVERPGVELYWSTFTKASRRRSTTGVIVTSSWRLAGRSTASTTVPTGMPGGKTLCCIPLVTTTSPLATLVPASMSSTGIAACGPLPAATPTSPDPVRRTPTLKAGPARRSCPPAGTQRWRPGAPGRTRHGRGRAPAARSSSRARRPSAG